MTDDSFKEWMREEISHIKGEMVTIRAISEKNSRTLTQALWFWRGIKFMIAISLALITLNWHDVLKMLGKS